MTAGAPMPVLAVSAVVLRADGQVLLVTRQQPPHAQIWTLPGGKVHFGERLRTAAAREVREETGLEVEMGAQVAVTEVIAECAAEQPASVAQTAQSVPGHRYHYVIVTFLARPRESRAPSAQSDAAAAAFFASEACLALATTPGLGEVLARARELARTETWLGHE